MAQGYTERITREDMAAWPASAVSEVAKSQAAQELAADLMAICSRIDFTNPNIDPYDAPIPPARMPIDPMGRE